MDVYHTSTHGVVLVRILNADLKCAARGSLEMQDKKLAKNRHLGTIAQLCRAISSQRIDNREKDLSSSMSCRNPHNMVNFGPLTAEIGSRVWGTPANFNGFRVFAALLHGIRQSSSERQPNFAALNRRRHLYSAGRSSCWALAHISG